MAQALQHDQATLVARLSATGTAGIKSVRHTSGTGRTDAINSLSRWFKISVRSAIITNIAETNDSGDVYPSTLTQTASYNNLNQLTNLSSQTLTYDANGNLLSDGQRNFTWDAENRLIGITYPSQPGKATTFTYNALGQRVSIGSTPAGGGSSVTTSYIWCGGFGPCQARDASDSPTREFLAEGEFAPGSPGQPYYYGIDQVGSVHRAFASTSSAPAYDYDPYGNALQAAAPLADIGYAGMFYNSDSGLYLTQYRAYDPVVGRWLSRDPLDELNDPSSNLYPYADGNPLAYIDPTGQQFGVGTVIGAVAGGIAGYEAGGWEGAAIGALVGGAVGTVAAPLAELAASAATGAGGAGAGFAAGAATSIGVNGAAGALGAVGTNLAEGNQWSCGALRGAAIGATTPVLSGEAAFLGAGGAAAYGTAAEYGFSAYSGAVGAAETYVDSRLH
jgi:RHS repeat-associated protein